MSTVMVAVLLATISTIAAGAYFYTKGVTKKPVETHETTSTTPPTPTTTLIAIPGATTITTTTIKKEVHSGGYIVY